MSYVYDAGMLVAADRNRRKVWADHRVRLELGLVPVVPAPVVAQASRSGRQVQLRRLLRGCGIVPFEPAQAHTVGALLGASRTTDVIDAHVVLVASERNAIVITSDDDDIARLSANLRDPIRVEHV